MEIKVSQVAIEKILDAVKEHNEKPTVRIYVAGVACSGAKFGIAFDDVKEGDETTEISGLTFITDTEYMPVYADGINIDFVTEPSEGFVITSLRPVAPSCGGGCSGCGQ
ncbi:HesB/IscA family protein [Fervidicella metallireducens]|uniref:HesB/IscA family protein n=1 Tax=Fervidicella metallireducens TaxID=655338 RepID=UPI000551A12A|nr:iron-sulfur cluster biosynthesis family protein [Fervidicella metallireducens]